ncbi:UDP-N-acetylmuramoylalanine--D-glutamate ligase [Deinobacterium chartae]|uniref:UDP-N-acetylmuramoylalanine--D-glutamate ligase n=1 Tax=Deinobacterium chartae TaxID=521158 RepID=A0A841I0S2_9DEIO|nr:UDP-N-acetylmuramoyl-L-alanine--D-glutamate ligase [Deinobacterium chartae]MBB6098009.1 UDP-N-acetylmuramoylalanine--D-glutamate ligase [Deinobacterium chartae]
MDVLIYGLGRSGRAVARFVHELGWQAAWYDQQPAEQDRQLMQELGLTAGDPRGRYHWVIAAPGVPIDHPDLEVLRAQGAHIIGEVELGFLTRRTPMIGITGTAGKGSTVSATAQLLRFLGVGALEGGNIDPPLLDVIDRAEVAVVELSSFQLERVRTFRPSVAVITNLGVDHIDRHGSVDAYHAAKLNLIRNLTGEDSLIVPASLRSRVSGTPAELHSFPDRPERIVDLEGQEVLPVSGLPGGVHPANAQAALLAALSYLRQLGRSVSPEELQAALRSLRPVAGRFETVAELEGVRFIEDSIATRTLAVKAALEHAPAPIAWIVGGVDKGAELADLEEVARARVRLIVAIGQDGPRFARHFGLPSVEITGQDGRAAMHAAVRAAFEGLEGAGSVLLAPLGTSFDQFRDYKDRGQAFREAVAELEARLQSASGGA